MTATAESGGAIGRCPVWCNGHTDQRHYANEFNFEDGAPCDDDHGLVLTLVEPLRSEALWDHGELASIPARLNVSLLQKFGAIRPTISLVGPEKPFQLTVEEAERLRDALTELLEDGRRDLRASLEARAGEVPA
ncbi:MAG TPA: hypothetical protein VN886_08870 [Acidimicrobiales bacterium]|nr:hypothetical protein [Acidimicrobiales bacterium]